MILQCGSKFKTSWGSFDPDFKIEINWAGFQILNYDTEKVATFFGMYSLIDKPYTLRKK